MSKPVLVTDAAAMSHTLNSQDPLDELNQIPPAELREHLFDILDSDTFDFIEGLPYGTQLAFAKWHAAEQARIDGWYPEPLHQRSTALELSAILNADCPNRQAADQWLEQHRDKISVDMLMELVSDTRIVSVADLMGERGSTKRKTTNKTLAKVATRWLELESKGDSKAEAAETIAIEVSRAYGTVYNYLTDKKYEERLYPEGIEAARKALGLHSK